MNLFGACLISGVTTVLFFGIAETYLTFMQEVPFMHRFFPDISFSLNQKFPSGQIFLIHLEMYRFSYYLFFSEALAYLNGTRS